MKFIDINSVRGLEIDQPVFTKDEYGKFGYGRLIEERKTSEGIHRTFEMARFLNLTKPAEANLPVPVLMATNITHVCIPK